MLDLYVRSGIYAVNEARQILGTHAVCGGETPLICGTNSSVPLGVVKSTGIWFRSAACSKSPGRQLR
jgi:hypothetical protein